MSSTSDAVKKFTLAEVAKNKDTKGHTKEVGIVLHDHVYNLTKFLDEVRNNVAKTSLRRFFAPRIAKVDHNSRRCQFLKPSKIRRMALIVH